MNVFEQGDILEVSFDPTIGHEQKKKRPAVVVSNRKFNCSSTMTLVCPITSIDNKYPLHEPIPEGHTAQGFVQMEQLRALDLTHRNAVKVDALSAEEMMPIVACIPSFFKPA